MFEVYIVWGDCPDPDASAECYKFSSTGEINAFIQGIDAAMGWGDYRIVHRNDDDSVTYHDEDYDLEADEYNESL